MNLKKPRNYYLKKIKSGELTCKQVANELEIAVDIVEAEYGDYINPFSNKKAERKNGIIQIVVSAFSAVFVLLTLFEMQTARNAAYRPDVCISFATETTGIDLSWDINGLLKESNLSTFSVPIEVRNIGVGTAKNVNFHWNWDEDIEKYVEIINQCENVKCTYNNYQLSIEKNGITSMYGNYQLGNDYFEYLKNTDESENSWFPIIYYNLVSESIYICRTQKLPDFSLNITYNDIQGKKYTKSYNISPKVIMWENNQEGESTCKFNFYVEEVKIKMGIWEYFDKFSDLAATVTAILALLVSVAALRDSHKYSRLQKEHNEKSVRPIAAILPIDYENRIAVNFKNVGTGPLKVKKMRFRSSNKEEKTTLVEMINSFMGPWNTFLDQLDGEVIPAGEKLCLLEIARDFDSMNEVALRDSIRKELADITVIVEYEDIYENSFTAEKKLDFFGRHFCNNRK